MKVFSRARDLTVAAALIAFLAAAALLSLIFRFAFRRRVRLPRNGRARLPRLGTVDSFDLDRQRQLVIIRRDNVEHLLMIGGPNDIVIELEIIRAESRDPRDLREARIRDKELRERELREAPPVAAGISWPSPADAPPLTTPQRKMPFPPAAGLELETGLTAAVPYRGIHARFRARDRFTNAKPAGFSSAAKAHAAARHSIWPRNIGSNRASPRRRWSAAKTRAWNQSSQTSSAPARRPSFFAVSGAAPGARDRRRHRRHQARPGRPSRKHLPQSRFPALRRSKRPRRVTWHGTLNFLPRPRRNPRDQPLPQLPPAVQPWRSRRPARRKTAPLR